MMNERAPDLEGTDGLERAESLDGTDPHGRLLVLAVKLQVWLADARGCEEYRYKDSRSGPRRANLWLRR